MAGRRSAVVRQLEVHRKQEAQSVDLSVLTVQRSFQTRRVPTYQIRTNDSSELQLELPDTYSCTGSIAASKVLLSSDENLILLVLAIFADRQI